MNDTLHGWLTTLLGLPLPAWAAIASALVGAAIPYLVESNVPMDEWSGWRFRLMTYGAAVLAGLIAGLTIWHDPSALVMWAPALVINCVRDVLASHWFPWLSPRRQVIVKRNAQGEEGFKVYNPETKSYDATVYTKPDPTGDK